MSDIHGCLAEFEEALSLVIDHLEKTETMLILLGDYIHGGSDSYGVLDKIIKLQYQYGSNKVLALMGNHEEFVLLGDSNISYMIKEFGGNLGTDNKYIQWIQNLPQYYINGTTVFVHSANDEAIKDLWKSTTREEIFVDEFPSKAEKINIRDMKVVAVHVATSEISGNQRYHDIYYDGKSHYYIDGDVLNSGIIPVLMFDTESDKYYRVAKSGNRLILAYNEN